MGPSHVRGAGRCWAGPALVVLVVLGARGAHGKETTGYFQVTHTSSCYFTNSTKQVRFFEQYLYNHQTLVHFDSDVGVYVADVPLGESDAKYWNEQPDIVAYKRGQVENFCEHNAQIWSPYATQRKVQPEVEIYPMQSGSLPQTDRLVCSVMDFYPVEIEVKWFKNGQEETERVVATDVIQNGDWTYQVLVMLETSPQRGDTYTCQVEHVSLQHPLTQHWGAQSDTARSKMLTGVGGLVLGLIFLALGLFLYLRNKKGRAGAQPAGLLS